MECEKPAEVGITIYSKSGCIRCNKVKELLLARGHAFRTIDADEYLIEDKVGFAAFAKSCAGRPTGGFPKVFADGVYLGGHAETKLYLDTKLTFDDF